MRLRSALLLNSGAALALPLAALVTGPLLARALGPEGRGALGAALSPTQLAVGVVNLGLPMAVLYFVARGSDPRRTLRLALLTSTGVGVVGIAVLFAAGPILLAGYDDVWFVYYVVAATLPVALAVEILRSFSQAVGSERLPVVERFTAALSRLLLISVAFAAGGLTLTSAGMYSWLPGVAVIVLYVAVRARSRTTVATVASGYRPIITYGIRGWGGNIAGMLLMRLDQVLLISLVAPRDLGFYIVAVSVAEVPLMAIGGFREVLTARSASAADPAMIARVCRVTTALSLVTVAIVALSAPWAVPLVFGADFSEAALPTAVLVLGSLFAGLAMISGAGLGVLGVPGRHSVSQIVGLAASVPLLLLLAPIYDVLGAAVASTIAYGLMLATSIMMFRRASGIGIAALFVVRRGDLAGLRRSGGRVARDGAGKR